MSALPLPLDADDAEVERAMRVAAQLPPAQQLEFIRTVYRYVYAYRRTRDPNLLTALASSVTGAVALYENPDYARAVERFRPAGDTQTVGSDDDTNRNCTADRERWAG